MDQMLRQLQNHSRDLVFTCEDKDENVIWMSFGHCAMSRWLNTLVGQSRYTPALMHGATSKKHRWKFVDAGPKQVLKSYRAAFNESMPGFLKSLPTELHEGSIPAVYPTVKRKCWKLPLKVARCKMLQEDCKDYQTSYFFALANM
eukprot:2369180-Karenia_brevis.AAC.1